MRPDALKGDGVDLKGFKMALEGDEEALVNNGGMLLCDREAINSNAKALKVKECC